MHPHLLFLISLTTIGHAAEWRFQLSGPTVPGYTRIEPGTAYDAHRGYGLIPGAPPDTTRLVLDVDEGNYDVTLKLGQATEATQTTVMAESRRLMLQQVETKPGEVITRTFTVNVRKPAIKGGGLTSLKEREKGPPAVPDWDERLTLEITGTPSGVTTLTIQPTQTAITVFLAGDSTVTDQAWGPYFGWGQMVPRFFKPGVSVSNHAESGLALYSFEGGRRLKKVQSMMQPGDYLFIQFGHNDQKDKRPDAGPFTTYKANLKTFIAAAREKGGHPVLITPMERRRWDHGQMLTTLDAYAEAVRQTGTEEKVPVIDLHAMSRQLYRALGEAGSTSAFVHYPANTFPNQPKALSDDTHHTAYGGYALARCIVNGIQSQLPDLAPHLTDDRGLYDPAKPDNAAHFSLPWDIHAGPAAKPDGT
jgi:lysophospholipase L1-like esterase